MMRRKKLLFFICLLGFIYLNNTSFWSKPSVGRPILVAHRGLGQTFHMEGITNRTNTAERIFKPEHPYLENTIPSIEAAFNYGADIVEIDLRLTKDGQFAIFHDDVLEYRTNSKGDIGQYTLAELKTLDVGYGYTADSGKTYPFRGKGIGLMPSLDEVLQHFPGRQFLLHIKNNDPKEGELLAQLLSKLSASEMQLLTVYGGEEPIDELKNRLPAIRVTSKGRIKKVLLTYAALGWTGYIPASMKNTELLLPIKYVPFLWGWPHKFIKRMQDANTRVVLMQGGEYSSGFDELKDLERLPDNYTGGIWTNRVDRIGGYVKNDLLK